MEEKWRLFSSLQFPVEPAIQELFQSVVMRAPSGGSEKRTLIESRASRSPERGAPPRPRGRPSL